jgi:hypothetical protein
MASPYFSQDLIQKKINLLASVKDNPMPTPKKATKKK